MVINYTTQFDARRIPCVSECGRYDVDAACFTTPEEIADFMAEIVGLRYKTEEYLYMLMFDTKMHLIGMSEVSHGNINGSICDPRSIFQRSLLTGAVSIAMVHNHPSGDYTPSHDDIESTDRLKDAGDIIGIPLLDHIIIGSKYFSFQENNMI